MERAIEVFAVLLLFSTGLSHIVQPRTWVEFFVLLRSKGRAGIFMVAILHLMPGALIAGFHNVWRGIPLVLTLIGWAWVIKGTLYLLVPGFGLRLISRVSAERAHEFVIGGMVLVGVSALLAYPLLLG
jgi:hypothetical protein